MPSKSTTKYYFIPIRCPKTKVSDNMGTPGPRWRQPHHCREESNSGKHMCTEFQYKIHFCLQSTVKVCLEVSSLEKLLSVHREKQPRLLIAVLGRAKNCEQMKGPETGEWTVGYPNNGVSAEAGCTRRASAVWVQAELTAEREKQAALGALQNDAVYAKYKNCKVQGLCTVSGFICIEHKYEGLHGANNKYQNSG